VNDVFKSDGAISMKIFVSFIVFTWTFGIFAPWLFAPLWMYWGVLYIAIPGAVMYTLVYFFAVKQLGEWKYILLLPVYSVIEALSWIRNINKKEFVVIDKS